MDKKEVFLRLSGISKAFPGVQALKDVGFEINKGEVHAICGENGAGKSTLMNILAGNYSKDEGTIEIEGKALEIRNHAHSLELGISVVYQERSLVPNLNVAENIFVERQYTNKFGFINNKKMNEMTKKLCDEIELDVQPTDIVGYLTPAQQQMVEIAKALSYKSKILILDEPTAALTERETKVLFEVIGKLKSEGISVIYISHRLQELFEIADTVTVLKDGKYVGTRSITELDINTIINMMVGRDLQVDAYLSHYKDEIVFEVKHMTSYKFRDITFKLRKGEILGFSGLAGAGRTELFRGIIGADPIISGEIYINGKETRIRNTVEAINNGIGYLPEDRKEQGLFLSMSIAENIISGKLESICTNGMIHPKKINIVADEYKKKLNIATPSVEKKVGELSGGNQQKVVFSKWLLVNSNILIIDEPTRGIDVGAKSEIYKIIRELSASGTSIVVISSDLPEVLAISDRIVVMYNGALMGELNREEATEEKVMQLASGFNN